VERKPSQNLASQEHPASIPYQAVTIFAAKLCFVDRLREGIIVKSHAMLEHVHLARRQHRFAVTARSLCLKKTVAMEFQLTSHVTKSAPKEIVAGDTNAIPFVVRNKFMTAKCHATDIWTVEIMCAL